MKWFLFLLPLKVVVKILTLVVSYLVYFLHIIFIFFGFNSFSKFLLEKATRICIKSLGINYYCYKKKGFNIGNRKEIHVSNHSNPLDILLVQGIFCMPSITTSHFHLRKILPGINYSINNYGHIILDHMNFNSKVRAFRQFRKILLRTDKAFIFPSGSLITPVAERFSSSISILSKENDAIVIPWLINYSVISDYESSLKYNPFRLLLSRLFGPDIIIYLKQYDHFDPREFSTANDMTIAMKAFYKSKK